MIVSIYGGFGLGNFGNEATLQATLSSLRRLLPEVEFTCICSGPEETEATHQIATRPINKAVIEGWRPENRILMVLRSILIGLPSQIYQWVEAFLFLRRTDVLLVPGTGLLTDAFGLRSWGPYSLFKWAATAKLRGCKVAYISVGAGPIYTRAGKWLTKGALSLADFRSYRDYETRNYLSSIFPRAAGDKVYPDLAFSLADDGKTTDKAPERRRPIVGVGLMLYHERLSEDTGRHSTYTAYLDQLALFVEWLLARGYDISLLIGELSDRSVVAEFKALLKDRLPDYDEGRIRDGAAESAGALVSQLAETYAVVATRFHNILLALVQNKPVISISFHQKCTSLMEDMGLRDYCQEIKQLSGNKLIEQFCRLEREADSLRQMIRDEVEDRRGALDEQYRLILRVIFGQTIAEDAGQVPSVAAQV